MMTACARASSETPVLYFYGELDGEARLAFEQHLERCEACTASLHDLQQVRLALANRGAIVREPAEWDGFMGRLEAALDGPRDVDHRRRFAPHVIALAATLVAGISIGLFWQQYVLGPRDVPPTAPAAPAASGAVPLEAAAARHFERAKIVVLGLALKDPVEATANDWEYERELAASLLPETRLFRLSAEDRGDARLAGLLSDLETVLLQAAMTADAEAPELKRLQRIIRGRDLIVRMDTTQGL